MTLLVTLQAGCRSPATGLSSRSQAFSPLRRLLADSTSCVGTAAPQYIASKQAAMAPSQQPDQRVHICSLVSRLAEADHLQTISHHRLCAVCLISNTGVGCCCGSQLHESYEMAYSFGLHPGPDMLQLSVCTGPITRSEYRLRIHCVWSTSPCSGQLRSEPCC